MGMGLPIARRLAEEHGGLLEVGNAPGGGVAAHLLLPPAGEGGEPGPEAEGERPQRSPGGSRDCLT